MSGLGLEGGAGEVESVSIAERLKLTDNIHVMDVPGGGYILLCGIYGEIEGHDKLPAGMKSTSYEKLLPVIAQAENCGDVKGVLTLINTVGGDVESGLAISEMLSSLSKPVVNIVLGGGHSIGVPLAVSGNVSFIVPTATMIVHPIRTNTAVLGVKQNFEYIEKMQERIIQFTVDHSSIDRKELEKLQREMKNPGFTIVPVRLFINEKGLAKLVVALAKGKKEYDKRESIKEKDDRRDMARMFKR